jgi:outer membrane protein TolC
MDPLQSSRSLQHFSRAIRATALLLAACAAPPPRVDVEAEVEAAVPASAIAFRAEGGPIDVASPAQAELTLPTALKCSVERSPELQAALARVRMAQAEADLAALLPNPILDVVLRWPASGGSPEIEAGIATDLLSILQRPRRSSAAGHRLEAEAASALAAALDVVAEVQELYARIQALDALAPLLEQRLAGLVRLVEVAQARLELGEGTRQEVTALAAERAGLAIELSEQRLALHQARLSLARRLGEPSADASWRLDAWSSPGILPTAEAPWIQASLTARPDLMAIEWELRARGDEAALAGASSLEGLELGVAAERQGGWAIGPSAATPLPVFDTGDARKDRARAAESEARHRLTEAQRKAVEEVRSSLAALAESQASLPSVEGELIPLAERRRSAVEQAFQLGLVDVTALLLAERDLQTARARRVTLEQAVSLARIRLERAVGGPSSFSSTVSRRTAEVQP